MGCCSRDKKIVAIFSHLCFELDYNQTLATQQLLVAQTNVVKLICLTILIWDILKMSGFSRNVSAGTLPITENIKLFLMKQSVWIFTGCDVAWNCRDLDYGLWFVCQVRERDKTQTIKECKFSNLQQELMGSQRSSRIFCNSSIYFETAEGNCKVFNRHISPHIFLHSD